MKIILLFALLFSTKLLADTNTDAFILLAKKTSSFYTLNTTIDKNNNDKIDFETLMNNQKVFLTINARKINSSVYTLINSEANTLRKGKQTRSLPLPPVVSFGSLDLSIDGDNLCSAVGDLPLSSDISCVGKRCNLTQLLISKCNETNCWEENEEVDRTFSEGISGNFNLSDPLNISSCLVNNNEGVKHSIIFSENEERKGGNINVSVKVVNDTWE